MLYFGSMSLVAVTWFHPELQHNPTMEQGPSLGHEVQKLSWTVERARARLKSEECLGAGFKIFICSLVLLEVPWTIIGVIAIAKLKRLARSRSSPEWPPDKIKRIAKYGLKLKPSLTTDINSHNNKESQRARAWVAECKLACWLLEQNFKGISVPASLAVDKYNSFWGMGPHGPMLTIHLKKFTTPKGWKSWMAAFRKTWDFDFASCPRGPTLSSENIRAKALHGNTPNTQHTTSLTHIFEHQ